MATSTIKQVTNNSDNGYCKMPDGTLIQWGIEASASDATTDIIMSESFNGTNYIVVGVDYGGYSGYATFAQMLTNKFRIYRHGGTSQQQWLAIGRWK